MAPDTRKVVDALRRLVIFGADQAAAYRELFAPVAEQLGSGIPTRLTEWTRHRASEGQPGVIVLTGNAGTGKTAVAEEFCRALGRPLPESDELVDVGDALLAKDVSGIPTRTGRAAAFRTVLDRSETTTSLVCANEGVLRDASDDLANTHPQLAVVQDEALRAGIGSLPFLTIINLNRQRLTAADLWDRLVDYVTRADLWAGCEGCPASSENGEQSPGCPMRANAEALRKPDTRAVLRLLVQTASGEAVPTMRETLAVLAYAICGDSSGEAGDSGMWTCSDVQNRSRDRGQNAFTASSGYFNLVFGAGLSAEIRERSPLMSALAYLGAGTVSDLEVDDWLRDPGRADAEVRSLAGSSGREVADGLLTGTRSPLDRVRTTAGEMTFHRLGEFVSISEDEEKVRACLHALVLADPPVQRMWRRRILLEGSSAMGGPDASFSRLTPLRHAPELIRLAQRVAAGADVITDVKQIIKGLNFLVTGYADASEGLIVPEPASLFARNPGSFRPARPAFVHAKVASERLKLDVPDTAGVAEVLDVDFVEVRLLVDDRPDLALTIRPLMFQAVREAELFRGPVGHGTAEMTDLRGFYGRLADVVDREPGMQVADPSRAALVRIQLPYFAADA